MTILFIYIIILGLGTLGLAFGFPRLKFLSLHWIYLIIPLAFITEICTHFVWTTHHPNAEIYWVFNLCFSLLILVYLKRHLASKNRKKIVTFILYLVLFSGILYALITHFEDLLPIYFIAFSDFFLILSIFLFYYDLLKSESNIPLIQSSSFIILSWVLLYLGLRFPYLMLVEILAQEIKQQQPIITYLFMASTITFYLGLIVYLLIRLLKQRYGRRQPERA